MAAKIVSFLLTIVLNAATGVIVFAFLIIAMNGYSGSDAQYGIIAFIVLSLIAALLTSFAAVLATGVLTRRAMHPAAAVAIAVTVFSVVGAVLISICAGIGIGIAEFVRVNY